MKKRICITGAAGFIGFHLARHLRARGDHVIGFDNFNDYYSPDLKHARADLLKKEGVDVILGDIVDQEALTDIIEEHQITHFVNLAAQAGVRYSLDHPQTYVSSNVAGFVSVVEACRRYPGIKLTYASSSSVYGNNTKVPFSTTDPTDNQASLYGVTKKTNELIAQTYHHLYGLSVTGLRFFTVYGPWGRPDMAYYSFTEKILREEPIQIYQKGELSRDFTYIDDIIAGTVAAIDLEAECEIFNLGNNQPVQVRDFVSILEKVLGKTAQKEYLPMQKGDVPTTFADIASSQEQLGFVPKMSLEEGLTHFVNWYREQYNAQA